MPTPSDPDLEYRDLAVRSLGAEEVTRETLHLLTFLFMHFLSYPNQTGAYLLPIVG